MKKVVEEIEVIDEVERKRASLVFQAYMDSEDLSQYNSKIKELSKVTHLGASYLRSLREIYVECCASDEEKIFYEHKKTKLGSKSPKSIVFCDHLFSLSDDKRFEYLLSNKVSVSDLKNYFDRYKNSNGKFSDLVDNFFIQYKSHVENLKALEKASKKADYLALSCSVIDEMISLGFYSIKHYAKYLSDGAYVSEKVECTLRQYRDEIVKNDKKNGISEWEKYESKMKRNVCLSFMILKDRIDKFSMLLESDFVSENKLDIIDYYLIVGIPLRKFRGLCNAVLDKSNTVYINIFVEKYVKIEDDYDNDLKAFKKLDVARVINGHRVTDSDIEKVLNFVYQYNIPFCFFTDAMYKYVNGGLSDYIDVKVKRISK